MTECEVSSSSKLKFSVDRILGSEPTKEEPPCVQCVAALYRCCRDEPPLLPLSLSMPYAHLHPALRPTTGTAYRPSDQEPSRCSAVPGKRKRSWSRSVFSNLQRKGLERRFQIQKYITKPDRRQLAATLGLTDAQVKVWFQNRRMKWRHRKENQSLPDTPAALTDKELPPAEESEDIDVDTLSD